VHGPAPGDATCNSPLALDGDEVLTDALGPVLADSHLAVRRSEWAAYSQQDVEVAQRGHFLRY
jgi:hypothetical protein